MKKGDRVKVFQRAFPRGGVVDDGHGLELEGIATLVKRTPTSVHGSTEHWFVRFDGEPEATYQRFVDPSNLVNPA